MIWRKERSDQFLTLCSITGNYTALFSWLITTTYAYAVSRSKSSRMLVIQLPSSNNTTWTSHGDEGSWISEVEDLTGMEILRSLWNGHFILFIGLLGPGLVQVASARFIPSLEIESDGGGVSACVWRSPWRVQISGATYGFIQECIGIV